MPGAMEGEVGSVIAAPPVATTESTATTSATTTTAAMDSAHTSAYNTVLAGVSLVIEKGDLVVVCGAVGRYHHH